MAGTEQVPKILMLYNLVVYEYVSVQKIFRNICLLINEELLTKYSNYC